MVKSEDTLLQKIIDYKYIGKNYTRKYKMGLISGIHVMYKIDFTKVAAKMNLLQVWDCDLHVLLHSDEINLLGWSIVSDLKSPPPPPSPSIILFEECISRGK